MHDLVAEDMIGLAEPRREREHDAAGEMVREAAHAVGDRAFDDRRLREVRVAGVQDDRLPPIEAVVQGDRQPRVPALGELRGEASRLLLGRVVIDVEMRRLEDGEIEAVVLHLVAAEVLRARRRCERQDSQRDKDPHPGHSGPSN